MKPLPLQRAIPFRAINHRASRASVIGQCATWRCVCGNPTVLQGRSGSAAGPTRDSVVVCDQCRRVYFVIPMDQAKGPPIEVVELFGLPEPEPPVTPAPSDVAGHQLASG